MAITGCELFYVNYKVNLTIKIRHCNEKNGEKREKKISYFIVVSLKMFD